MSASLKKVLKLTVISTAAGIKLFMENAFNEKTAIAIGMFYVVLGAGMVGAESYLLSSVLIDSAGMMISPAADRFFWQIIFILIVGYINYRGIQITGRTQDVLTYLMFGFLIFVSVYTLTVKDINYAEALSSQKFTVVKVLSTAAVGVFMYVGFEWVAPLAEETTDYRMIGKGMMYAVGLLSVAYSLFVVAMYSGLTEEQMKSGTTIPHILFARNLFGATGGLLFILMSIIASVTSFNAGLLNISRFTYAMAAFAIACVLYTPFAVPKLKAFASERASLRKKRRPGRSGGVTEFEAVEIRTDQRSIFLLSEYPVFQKAEPPLLTAQAEVVPPLPVCVSLC